MNTYSHTAIELPAATVMYTENAKDRQTRKWFFTWPHPQTYAAAAPVPVPIQWNINSGGIQVWTLQIDSTWSNYTQNKAVVYADGHAKVMNTKGRDSYFTLSNTLGLPTFGVPGINYEAYAIGGFWFRPAGLGAKS